MTKVVVIKFKSGGKLYYFSPKEGEEYKRNQPVIVETSKGVEYAWVAYPEQEVEDDQITQPLKSVLRTATEKDTEFYESCLQKKPEAMSICRKKIIELGLDMKLVDCEYAFDGSKIIFFFTSAGRVDFRELVRALASAFKNRIELRQVGTRDETKYLGGLAPCGRVCCCAGNMPEFKKVSIKMAKNQGLSLNPGKISGLCGRLMCCLSYENDYYAEAFKQVPKIGSEASSSDGSGIVVAVNMLKMTAKLRITDSAGNVAYRDYNVSDLKFKKVSQAAANTETDQEEEDTEDSLLSEENTISKESAKTLEKTKKENQPAHNNHSNKGGGNPAENNSNHGNNGSSTNQKKKNKHKNKHKNTQTEGGERPEKTEKTGNVFDSSSIF